MNDYRFRLQPYKGINTRYTCPECKQKRCFTRYIDTEGRILFPSYVGRCDHEQRCGYHYTPSDYFKDHPFAQEQLSEERKPVFIPRVVESPKPISYIPSEIVEASMQHYETNRKNPERGSSLTSKERTRQRTHQQGHAHLVKKSDGRSDQPEPVGKTG